MKTMRRYFGYFLAVVLIAVTAACSKNSYEDYMTVIPKDAKGVAAVRFDNVVNQTGVARSPLIRMALSKMSSAMSADVETKVKALIDDPSLSGIDFSSPAYAFVINNQSIGVTMKVEDASLLDELVATMAKLDFCTKAKKSNDYQWTSLADGSARMVYSDNTLLIVFAGAEMAKSLDQMMLDMMRLDVDDSFVTTPQFVKLHELKYEDLQVYFNLGVDVIKQTEFLKELLPTGAKPADYEFVAGVNLREGGVDAQSLLFSTNEKAQKEFDDYFASLKPIKGEYVNKIPRDSKVWACMGAEGDKLVDLLKRVPKIKEALLAAGFVIDAEQMLRSIDGDMLIYAKPDQGEMGLYAQLGKSDFLKDVDSWMESAEKYGYTMKMESTGSYQVKGEDVDLHWAIEGKQLYVGTKTYQPLSVQGQNKHADDMDDALFYAFIDLNHQHLVANSVVVKSTKPGEIIIKADIASFPEILWKGL